MAFFVRCVPIVVLGAVALTATACASDGLGRKATPSEVSRMEKQVRAMPGVASADVVDSHSPLRGSERLQTTVTVMDSATPEQILDAIAEIFELESEIGATFPDVDLATTVTRASGGPGFDVFCNPKPDRQTGLGDIRDWLEVGPLLPVKTQIGLCLDDSDIPGSYDVPVSSSDSITSLASTIAGRKLHNQATWWHFSTKVDGMELAIHSHGQPERSFLKLWQRELQTLRDLPADFPATQLDLAGDIEGPELKLVLDPSEPVPVEQVTPAKYRIALLPVFKRQADLLRETHPEQDPSYAVWINGDGDGTDSPLVSVNKASRTPTPWDRLFLG